MKEREVLIIENAEKRADCIKELIEPFGAKGKIVKPYLGEEMPLPSNTEAVIISGGPMSIYEANLPQYEYLKREADFIAKMVDKNRAILGICLGHQLLAHVLGGKVKPIADNLLEIGWPKIFLNNNGKNDLLFSKMPHEFQIFQYHRDETIDLPRNTINLACSKLCGIQAFRYSNKPIWGIQFHPEISLEKSKEILQSRKVEIEKQGLDFSLTVEQGLSVSQKPRKQIFLNFIKGDI